MHWTASSKTGTFLPIVAIFFSKILFKTLAGIFIVHQRTRNSCFLLYVSSATLVLFHRLSLELLQRNRSSFEIFVTLSRTQVKYHFDFSLVNIVVEKRRVSDTRANNFRNLANVLINSKRGK